VSRGPDPRDAEVFGPDAVPRLVVAVGELSRRLSRGYADVAARTLGGDHHQLTDRQRKVVARGSCSDAGLARRTANRRERSGPCAVDGFNQLIGLERALSGGPLFRGRDGALRDLAQVHGTWRASEVTELAIARLVAHVPSPATIVLDRPVSNSGRLAAALRDARDWTVEVDDRADSRLLALGVPLATGDGALLERAPWFDLVGDVLAAPDWPGPAPWVVDLSAG
jgi:hypothetical protein